MRKLEREQKNIDEGDGGVERKKYHRAYTKRAKNPPRERPKARGNPANRSKTSNEVATDQLTSRKRKRALSKSRRLPGFVPLSS